MRLRSEKVAGLRTAGSVDDSLSMSSTASSIGDETSWNLQERLPTRSASAQADEGEGEGGRARTHVVACSRSARMLSLVTSVPESRSRSAKRAGGSVTAS